MPCHPCHATPTSPARRALHVAGHIVAGLALAAVLALVFGGVVTLLWNRLLPELLGVKAITFWQSVGLILLTRILVGGLHHGRSHGRGHYGGHGRWGHRHGHGRAWRDYEEWWREVGEKSYQDYAGKNPQ